MPLRIFTVTGTPRGLRRVDGGRDDRAEQVALPGQHRSPAAARDLGHRAAEVEVDVVGAVLADHEPDGGTDRRGVHAVDLDGARSSSGSCEMIRIDSSSRSTSARDVTISAT